MLLIQDEEERAAASQNPGEMVGAPVVRVGGISADGADILVQLHQPLTYPDTNPAVVRVIKDMANAVQDKYRQTHGRIDNFSALVEAHKTYQEMTAAADDQGVYEQPDEGYMSATFHGIREAVTRKCGEMPVGCWRCERDKRWTYAGGISIRHDGDKHYIAFTDASGNRTEYRIWFCPFCGKKL